MTATIRTEMLGQVKTKLKELGVLHITIDGVSGYENPDRLFEMPDLITHIRVEILSEEAGIKKITDCIVTNAYAGTYDDGVISISPVDDVIKINPGGKKHC
ncbi:MAG: P-II family nitrogen regulator [Gammaproteobacteria bacterium]